MKGLLPFLFLLPLFFLSSCGEEEPKEVDFFVSLKGFAMEQVGDSTDTGFQHRLAGGILKFTHQYEIFGFDAKQGIEAHTFSLLPGEYLLEGAIPVASLYGQEGASFKVVPVLVNITAATDTVMAEVEANCSLVLVWDRHEKLDEAPYMLERHYYAHGYFIPYPLSKDSLTGAWYCYLTPDRRMDDPSAFLWFYGDSPGIEEGGLSTAAMEEGKVYNLEILE